LGTIRVGVWWVREEVALAGDEVIHAQVRELVADVMATAQEYEATTGRYWIVLIKEVICKTRHVGGYMVVQK
jgi:hypothetical protein